MSLTVILALVARNLVKTRVGRAFIAIRDADIAAETIGVNLVLYKTMAFAVSAFYAGIAGGLCAFVLRFIEPEIFTLLMSILFLAMVVVGGLGSIFGAITGACLLSWLDLQLRNILSIPYVGGWLEWRQSADSKEQEWWKCHNGEAVFRAGVWKGLWHIPMDQPFRVHCFVS